MKNVDLVLENVVGGIALEASDFHRVTLEVENDAGAFTKDLSRADTGTTGAEDVGGENGAGRSGRIAIGDFFDERRDVDPGRTGHDAWCVVAEEAAVGLDEGFLPGVAGFFFRHALGGRLGIEQRFKRHDTTWLSARTVQAERTQ